FNFFYPTQAPYAPVLNASSSSPQSFTQDVILNARISGKEMDILLDMPKDLAEIFRQGAGVLHYNVTRLTGAHTRGEAIKKQEELARARFSMDISSNKALTGPAYYPQQLNELPSSVIYKMLVAGAISEKDKRLFGDGDAFVLSPDSMIEIVNKFHKEMKAGLQGEKGSLAMLPAFVSSPTGKEKGIFLALDLGGSTLRVLMVYLPGDGNEPEAAVQKYTLKADEEERRRGIEYDYTQGSADELFKVIARHIKNFLVKYRERIEGYGYDKLYPLGFTFSFPVTQSAIDKALLNKWAKEFGIKGLVNNDVVMFLRKALNAEGIDDFVKVVSLNNDTVGTLAARRYSDPECDIAGIVGTGTNFCYEELVENIPKLTGEGKAGYSKKTMIINIESGNFNHIAQNVYDKILDRDSMNSGGQVAEKMVSGLYLGELTRLVLIDYIRKGLLFRGQVTQEQVAILSQRGSFNTPVMTEIAEDDSDALQVAGAKLEQWGIKINQVSLEDKRIVKEICGVVAMRAARVTAAIIFAIVTHIDKYIQRRHTIAMDGSLFEKYPAFKEDMKKAIKQLSVEMFKDDRSGRISFKLSPDGSGVGAGIIAAMAVS
ncbi:MAG: hypothetical protein ABH914_01140, partial [Candidatus Omnitrophota bacterium]